MFSFLTKKEFYKHQKEQKSIERENRLALRQDDEPYISNFPGALTFMRRITETDMRYCYRKRVCNSIILNEPSVVFDFRYIPMHTRDEIIKSMYRQFIEIISRNRTLPNPFQLHFCNYDYESIFHKRFATFMGFDTNLIFETPKNYLDVFPKEKLVYLSRDAKFPMTKYNPDKVYIIGSIIDINDTFKFSSYAQAKKEGIRCERLPIDEHVK